MLSEIPQASSLVSLSTLSSYINSSSCEFWLGFRALGHQKGIELYNRCAVCAMHNIVQGLFSLHSDFTRTRPKSWHWNWSLYVTIWMHEESKHGVTLFECESCSPSVYAETVSPTPSLELHTHISQSIVHVECMCVVWGSFFLVLQLFI